VNTQQPRASQQKQPKSILSLTTATLETTAQSSIHPTPKKLKMADSAATKASQTRKSEKPIHIHSLVINKILSSAEEKFAMSYDCLLHLACQALLHRQNLLTTAVFFRPQQELTNSEMEEFSKTTLKINKLVRCIDLLEQSSDISATTIRFLTTANHPGLLAQIEAIAPQCRLRYALIEFMHMVFFNKHDADSSPTTTPKMDALGWNRLIPAWLKLANLEVDAMYTGLPMGRIRSSWNNLLLALCVQVLLNG